MVLNDRLRFVGVSVLYLSLIACLLAALGAFSPELFVLVSVFGFITIAEIASTSKYMIQWQARIRLAVGIGLVLFTIAAIRYIAQITP